MTDFSTVPPRTCARSTNCPTASTWPAAGSTKAFVSKHHPGSVITLSIEPTLKFNERSVAPTVKALGGPPAPDELPNASGAIACPPWTRTNWRYMLFCCDNPPGTEEISGAQDSVGLVFPGLARSDYDGAYWPHYIEHLPDEGALCFVENLIHLHPPARA